LLIRPVTTSLPDSWEAAGVAAVDEEVVEVEVDLAVELAVEAVVVVEAAILAPGLATALVCYPFVSVLFVICLRC